MAKFFTAKFLAVILGIAMCVLAASPAEAKRQGEWELGGRVEGYGPVGVGIETMPLDPNTSIAVHFDVSVKSREGAISRQLETVARFLNMHRKAGLRDENVKAAIVVHGEALKDILKPSVNGRPNLSKPLVEALLAAGATITVCGQSAVSRGYKKEDFLPGITVSLSAMTAHALLAKQGYSLNPF